MRGVVVKLYKIMGPLSLCLILTSTVHIREQGMVAS